MTGSVGTDLRHAREQACLSLLDLSARTKIRIPLLEAIEREQFERLPAGLLTRGYLRAYAREVGLDPESVVRRYLDEFEPVPLPPAPRPLEPLDTEWDDESPGRTRWAMLAPVIPLTLAALFFLLMSRPAQVAPVQPMPQVAPVRPTPQVAPVGTTGQAKPDDTPGRSLGGPGEIRDVRITPDTFADYPLP